MMQHTHKSSLAHGATERGQLLAVLSRARHTARSGARGVTLVEVLIVVAIMAMLAGGVAFALLPKFAETQKKTAKQGAIEIRRMVQAYQLDKGGECPSVSQLKKEGLMDKAGSSQDPWGNQYQIRCDDNEIYVSSPGGDKKKGTPDDIEVPGPSED
jgi:general secretion pathway protein G